MINDAFAYTENKYLNIAIMPFAECDAMSQGYIGYNLQNVFVNHFYEQKITKNAVALITQVLIAADDLAFTNPTKLIGPFYQNKKQKILLRPQ